MSKAFMGNRKGCHLWTVTVDREGYGRMRLCGMDTDGKKHNSVVRVSRLALFLSLNGSPIPDSMHSSHLCHEPSCFNQDHLVLESHALNQERKVCKQNGQCKGHAGQKQCIFRHIAETCFCLSNRQFYLFFVFLKCCSVTIVSGITLFISHLWMQMLTFIQ